MTTLHEFAEEYRATRSDWSAGTRANFDRAVDNAAAVFGAARPLDAIAPADGDALREVLASDLAPATACARLKIVKGLLWAAQRAGLIAENPLADLRTHCRADWQRTKYIDPATAAAIADGLIEPTRTVFVLARFAGLRVVSEVHALRWEHVDFRRGVLRVSAPKRKRTRAVPMTATLRDELLLALEAAPAGGEYVIQPRSPLPVIRRATLAAIEREELRAWRGLFESLRASFAADTVREWPADTAAAILGRSAAAAGRRMVDADEDPPGRVLCGKAGILSRTPGRAPSWRMLAGRGRHERRRSREPL